MGVLLAIAIKSLLVAGVALGLLRLMRSRSAAERSMVAHAGLIALVLLAFAPLVLPRLTIEAPAIFQDVQSSSDAAAALAGDAPVRVSPTATVLPDSPVPQAAAPSVAAATSLPPTMIATALYALPAAILLILTLLAVFRLVALRTRAEVLVDTHWLSALARAQRRMGFKHGTALLTSNDLNSPVSWGVVRPVILLNERAVEAAGEAEAIIAHELAHVARLDWMKLILARIATALFWFNPLVWMLAREAHQLREETADDAVLAANIEGTDYAELLVGVARHDCAGLLLGAHGVAPSKKSLHRRIARVLDRSTVRGNAARPFALGVIAGAAVVAAPLAALTFIPASVEKAGTKPSAAAAATSAYAASEPADLGSLIASGVSTSVSSAVSAVAPEAVPAPVVLETNPKIMVAGEVAERIHDARHASALAAVRTQAIAESRGVQARAEARADEQIEMAALGITPQYIAQLRAASPALRNTEASDLVQLKAVGATPDYIRELSSSGFGNLDADALTEARAVGVTGGYAKAMRAVGVRVDLDSLVEMRAVGVTPDFVSRLKRAGHSVSNPERIVELYVMVAGRNGRTISQPRGDPPKTYDPPPLPDEDGGG